MREGDVLSGQVEAVAAEQAEVVGQDMPIQLVAELSA